MGLFCLSKVRCVRDFALGLSPGRELGTAFTTAAVVDDDEGRPTVSRWDMGLSRKWVTLVREETRIVSVWSGYQQRSGLERPVLWCELGARWVIQRLLCVAGSAYSS